MNHWIIAASDQYDIDYIFLKLQETFLKRDLNTKISKTQHPLVGAKGDDLNIDRNVFEACEEFKYLDFFTVAGGVCMGY